MIYKNLSYQNDLFEFVEIYVNVLEQNARKVLQKLLQNVYFM